ncbi:hypothetical protein D3C83_170030 [compost metagenome]
MTEKPDDRRPGLLQLLEELQRLEEEHRTLDLRDPSALERHRQRIDALRQKINAQPRETNRAGGVMAR